MEYYFMLYRDAPGVPVARAAPGTPLLPSEPAPLSVPLVFRADSSHLTDYLANDLVVRLCSQRLREVIDAKRASEAVLWIPAAVEVPTGSQHVYSVLRLVPDPSILDPQRTLYARGEFVVRPIFRREALGTRPLVSFPTASVSLVVSAALRSALQQAGITGLEFAPAIVV